MTSPNDLVGIPYKEGGRTKEEADCWGLCIIGMEEIFRIIIERHKDLITTEEIGKVTQDSEWEKRSSPAAGCIAVMFDRQKQPSHIGLCIDRARVLHTAAIRRTMIGHSVITRLRSLRMIYPHTEYYSHVSQHS